MLLTSPQRLPNVRSVYNPAPSLSGGGVLTFLKHSMKECGKQIGPQQRGMNFCVNWTVKTQKVIHKDSRRGEKERKNSNNEEDRKDSARTGDDGIRGSAERED